MPKKCKGKRNALVVTVVAVLLGDIFAGGQNIPAQQKTWNAGDTTVSYTHLTLPTN